MRGSYDRLLAGRYRLLEPIGSGGMGTVWWARDESFGTEVAVKEIHLPPGDQDRLNAIRRSHREALTAGRLRHPGIAKVHEIIVDDGRPWLIMEYVPARSLEQVIDMDGPLSPGRVADMGLSLLSALCAAHQAGILHRDVKPGNVLLGTSGRVVLTDFGIATWDGATRLTQSGTFMGSPAYVAPEIARGKAATIQSDLWSLGATLYTAVEGRPPYHHETALATLGALLTENPDPPRRAGDLKGVLEGLLQRNPAKRPPAAQVSSLLTIVRTAPSGTPGAPGRRTGMPAATPRRPESFGTGIANITNTAAPAARPHRPRRQRLPVRTVLMWTLGTALTLAIVTLIALTLS